jgi:hypothetical protein
MGKLGATNAAEGSIQRGSIYRGTFHYAPSGFYIVTTGLLDYFHKHPSARNVMILKVGSEKLSYIWTRSRPYWFRAVYFVAALRSRPSPTSTSTACGFSRQTAGVASMSRRPTATALGPASPNQGSRRQGSLAPSRADALAGLRAPFDDAALDLRAQGERTSRARARDGGSRAVRLYPVSVGTRRERFLDGDERQESMVTCRLYAGL